MSWLFSRALVEDCLRRTSSGGGPFALSSWIGTADAFLHSDKMNDTYETRTQFGMTFVPLTADRGAGALMSYLEGFHAKPIRQQLRVKTLQMTSGRKCDGSWQMSLPGTYLPRTLHEKPSTQRRTTSRRWVMKPAALSFPRKTWVATTFGADVGYLHTPTTQGNYCAPSMQKWPACRAFARVFGKVTPESQKWLMGWPIGWTELQPLETDRFQRWRSAHFSRCVKDKEAA